MESSRRKRSTRWTPGAHVISEAPHAGYQQVGIHCFDLASTLEVGADGTVNVAAGQDAECTVFNAEVPAELTLTKFVKNDNGGNAISSDFQLLVDNAVADQNTKLLESAGTPHHWRDGCPWLSTGQHRVHRHRHSAARDVQRRDHVGARPARALPAYQRRRSDRPGDHQDRRRCHPVAGGPSFDYTITVDNLGPRDASIGEPVTVTDQLPAGFDFVFLGELQAIGQAVTCNVNPADLQVADPPVMISITVKVQP